LEEVQRGDLPRGKHRAVTSKRERIKPKHGRRPGTILAYSINQQQHAGKKVIDKAKTRRAKAIETPKQARRSREKKAPREAKTSSSVHTGPQRNESKL